MNSIHKFVLIIHVCCTEQSVEMIIITVYVVLNILFHFNRYAYILTHDVLCVCISVNLSYLHLIPSKAIFCLEDRKSSCINMFPLKCASEHANQQRRHPQQIILLLRQTAQRMVGTSLPTVKDIYTTLCLRNTQRITEDSSHPALLHLHIC